MTNMSIKCPILPDLQISFSLWCFALFYILNKTIKICKTFKNIFPALLIFVVFRAQININRKSYHLKIKNLRKGK